MAGRVPEWAWILAACLAMALVTGVVAYLVTVWYLSRGLKG